MGAAENMTAAETEGYQTQFSVRQFAQALDFDIVIDEKSEAGFKIVDPATGEVIKKVLPAHMASTPMGILIDEV